MPLQYLPDSIEELSFKFLRSYHMLSLLGSRTGAYQSGADMMTNVTLRRRTKEERLPKYKNNNWKLGIKRLLQSCHQGEASKAGSVNGHGNGGEIGYALHAPLKVRDGLAAPDRSTTPALPISATPFDLTAGNFPYPAGSASVFRPSTPAPAGTTLDTGSADSIFESVTSLCK
ncbi:hypothetical protein BJ170DRAFT_695937 [Xylariales sp. AK1849]|nr:hypothetical protein BJ170DRAFT_695937 [Xylariales sp. AK1849]